MSRSKRGSRLALVVLLWFVGLSHLAVGGLIMLSPALQRQVADLYGAQVDWTPQFVYILRPLGAFMVTVGLAAIVAASDPARYRLIVNCVVVLLLLRVAQRLLLSGEISSAFAMEPMRNMFAAGFFFVIAIALLVLVNRRGRRGHP